MKLGTIIKYALVGTAGYYVGKVGIGYIRERAGQLVSSVKPKAQQVLTAGYTQGMSIVNAALQNAGVTATVSPGVFDGKPALLVKTEPGTDQVYAAQSTPAVAAGMPVVVQ